MSLRLEPFQQCTLFVVIEIEIIYGVNTLKNGLAHFKDEKKHLILNIDNTDEGGVLKLN